MRYKVCAECGSDQVRVTASAVWHAANEEWIVDPLVGVTDEDEAVAYCDTCDDSTELEEKEA